MLRWFESDRLPERFTAFGIEWRVTVSSLHEGAGAANTGGINNVTKEMWVEKAGRPDAQWSTHAHELLHVFDRMLGIGLRENQVRMLETALVSYFRENHITIEQPEPGGSVNAS